MRVISKKKLREFWEKHPQAKDPLNTWYQIAKHARWKTFVDVKADFPRADYVGNDRYVFDVLGNKYRLVIWWVDVAFRIRAIAFEISLTSFRKPCAHHQNDSLLLSFDNSDRRSETDEGVCGMFRNIRGSKNW